MSGHKKWDDVRAELGLPGRVPWPAVRASPPNCDKCGKRVWRWQSYGGWGPMGFSPRTADVVWHSRCLRAGRGGTA